MALHVDDHLEQVPHKGFQVDAVGSPRRIAEEHGGEALGVGVGVAEAVAQVVALLRRLVQTVAPRLVEVVLQGVADVVMYACRGVSGHQLLALGHHRQDAAVDGRRAGIDLHAPRLDEDLGEVLGHAPPYAVVLALADGRQVAQALVRGLVEQLQLAQRLLPLARQLVLPARFAQRAQHALVVVLADEPARAVAPVVRQVDGDVALRCPGVLEVGQLAVVVHIVRARQPRVLCQVFVGRRRAVLCAETEHCAQQHCSNNCSFHLLSVGSTWVQSYEKFFTAQNVFGENVWSFAEIFVTLHRVCPNIDGHSK